MSNDNSTIGKFKLVNCLATGQSSQVWEAIDNETTRRVAIKMLLPEALTDPDHIASLKSEFKVASSLEHPNILKYHEIFVKSDLLFGKTKYAYFSMDLFPAMNLKGWYHNDLRGVHIRFKRMVELVSVALEHVHEKGWIHRDLKPENILMTKAAEVRLIDFSLATRAATTMSKVFSRKQATVKGTRTYMAPEQIRGKPLTVQTDIYNLGVTLFELLTGQAPFAGATPKEILLRHVGEPPPDPTSINSNITPEMERILLRMLAKKPADRHKSVAEFLVEFRNVSVFKEPVTEAVELTEDQKAEEVLKKVLGGALDSRADAMRTKLGIAAPAPPPKKTPPKKAPAPKQPAPAPPQMMPGMMPQPAMPMMPYPMQPMYPQPAMPTMPGMPMPGGPTPWVSVPAAGVAPAPWGGQGGGTPAVGIPFPNPMVAGSVPAAPRPMPPPVAPAAIPQVPAPGSGMVLPPAVVPVSTVSKPPARQAPKAAPPAGGKPEQGMKIDDLLGFDELPPVG